MKNLTFESSNSILVSKGIYMDRVDNLYIGSVPLQSKKIPIDFGFAAANTLKGLLSIKVWVYK